MKKILIFTIFLCVQLLGVDTTTASQPEPATHYVDARQFTVIGQPIPYPEQPFYRMNGTPMDLKGP